MSARAPKAAPAETHAHVPNHKPFSWLHHSLKDNAHAEFTALTFDICRGAGLCLQLVRESEIARDNDPLGAYLSIHHVEHLEAMAIRSLQMLAEHAESAIGDLNDAALRREAGGAE